MLPIDNGRTVSIMDSNHLLTGSHAMNLYTLAIDWTSGRAPSYESWRKWNMTENQARQTFARYAPDGYSCALIDSRGRILITQDR